MVVILINIRLFALKWALLASFKVKIFFWFFNLTEQGQKGSLEYEQKHVKMEAILE